MMICSECECITDELVYCDKCDALHCLDCFTPSTDTLKEGEDDDG